MRYLRLASLFVFTFSFFPTTISAQQKPVYKVFGQLKDTAEKKNLENASVVLLSAKDSLLYKTTRANANQQFSFNNVDTGKYVVLIAYPGYANLVDRLSVENSDVDLGGLVMNTKVRILQEVVLKGKVAAIRMRGDTTEYTADSFRVAPNADVQELLRSMPGFTVNSKGEIVTQGEKVNKILVDGEEFFSDDPAVVTKNLRADAIDKVQVFDKKSDQAAFTGIDDGERTKTINLKLKEDKKRGYFGKAEAGTNLNGLNSDRLMANSFKGKRKIAGYVTNDNTTFQGLNWEDSRNYGEGSGNTTMEISDDGGIMISVTGDGDGTNVGLPNQQTGGAMFSNKFGKLTTNNGGQFQRMQTNFTGNDYTTTLLSSGSQTTSSNKNLTSDRKKYKINTSNEWGTDSAGYFKLVVRGSKSLNDVVTDYNSSTVEDNNYLLNSSLRNTKLSADELTFSTSLLFRKKFAKKGRSILFKTDFRNSETNQDLFLKATNKYYRGIIINTEIVDQFKSSSLNEATSNNTLTYTEPLGKKDFIVFDYGLSIGKNMQGRNTYDKDGAGHYETLVDSLSNRFRFNNSNNNLRVSYRYATKKTNVVVGLGGGHVNYGLTNYETASKRSVSYNNFLPSATFSYNQTQQRRFRIYYYGNTINPTLNQIQPIVDNLNPLDVTVGNPNLRQGFTHSIQSNFNDYKVLKDRSFNFWGNFNSTTNAISTNTTLDIMGKRTTAFVNVNGSYGWSLSANYGRKLFKSFNADLGIRPGLNRNVNYINGVRNISNYRYTTLSLNLSKWGEKNFTFYFGGNASYNKSTSTINPAARAYWSYFGWGNLMYKMKKAKLYFNQSIDITAYQKSPLFPNRKNIFLFHPAVRKVFGKGDAWEAKVLIYDLFNKNQNVDRNFTSNIISESSHNGIRRYAMFSLIYNFSKNGKPQSSGF